MSAKSIPRMLTRVRATVSLGLLDGLFVGVSYVSALVLRFDGSVPYRFWDRLWHFLPVAILVHLIGNFALGLYGQMWRHAGIAEARRVLLAGTITCTGLSIIRLIGQPVIPLSAIVLGTIIATMLSGALRFQSRLFAFHRARERRFGRRVLVVGTGNAAAAIVREMQRDSDAGLYPVAVLSDDPRCAGLGLAGVPVAGTIEDLSSVAHRYQVHQVLLAVPNAPQELVKQVAGAADAAGVPLKVVPRVHDVVGGQPSVRDVRDLQIEDLLGRTQVSTDLEGVRRLLGGRRVLISGGGGSIGSEIARQVADCGPAELVLLDHDETHLHDATDRLGHGVDQVLADIRDDDHIQTIFRRYQPEIVFHAAAHKHVPVLEAHACEAVKTNVLGTLNVVRAAVRTGAQRFVFISTDKAVRPSSVMGASKWLGEQLVVSYAPSGGRYCAVRFGNVLGSRGSVIPTFARQIAAGGPVTVTDPRMTRFFMSVHEAVQLVLQAAVFAKGGEVFMLEMGDPVNILELAERMIRLSGRTVGSEIAIQITGRRPGEKLVEELRDPNEKLHPTPHPAIVRLFPARLPHAVLRQGLDRLIDLVGCHQNAEAAQRLQELAAVMQVQPVAPDTALNLAHLNRSPTWSPSTT